MGFLNDLYYLTVRKSLAQENSIMRKKNYESLAFVLPVIKFSFWDEYVNI